MSDSVYFNAELKELAEALKMLGATQNAVALYMASFTTGRTTVGKLASICQMDRSSAYIAVEQLRELGVLETDETSARKTILARPPKAVLSRLRTEMRRLRRQHDTIEESLPGLLASYVAHESKPTLQFFSGIEGLHQIADDVLEYGKEEVLLYTNQATEENVFSEADHKEFIAERLRRGLSIRVLAADVPESYELQRRDKQCRRETRIVDGEPFTSETYIYADKVAMLSFDKEIIGFVVRSKDFAQAQRWMFEQIWEKHGGKNA
ncbi:MAG: hypothetical protein WC802_03090 [Patescibacteria group bacterium]|jgi:hypothetical protein